MHVSLSIIIASSLVLPIYGLERFCHGQRKYKDPGHTQTEEIRNLNHRRANQSPPPKPQALELQIDSSDSHLPFYQDVPDQDFEASADYSTV